MHLLSCETVVKSIFTPARYFHFCCQYGNNNFVELTRNVEEHHSYETVSEAERKVERVRQFVRVQSSFSRVLLSGVVQQKFASYSDRIQRVEERVPDTDQYSIKNGE